MSPARWSSLPKGARVKEGDAGSARSRKGKSKAGIVNHGTWRCGGPNGCGEEVTGSFDAMEKHMADCGGSRAEAVFDSTNEGK